MTTLRDRCREILATIQAETARGVKNIDPVEILRDFVLAEQGRAADKSLTETLPLVLYFGSDADRDEFIAAVREAKPNMISRKFP